MSSSFATEAPPTQQAAPAKPNYDPFGSVSTPHNNPLVSPSPRPPQQQPSQQQSLSADPFAALSSPTPRQNSPFQFQQSLKSTSSPAPPSSLVDLAGPPQTTPSTQAPPPSAAPVAPAAPANDDEWTFSSSLPNQSSEITVVDSSINVVFEVSRESPGGDVVLVNSRVSNNTAAPINEMTFQLAVTKVSPLPFYPSTALPFPP